MSLDFERKPDHPEETHPDKGRCEHANSTQSLVDSGIEPRTFLVYGDCANHCAAYSSKYRNLYMYLFPPISYLDLNLIYIYIPYLIYLVYLIYPFYITKSSTSLSVSSGIFLFLSLLQFWTQPCNCLYAPREKHQSKVGFAVTYHSCLV